jgi:hypothetical protein
MDQAAITKYITGTFAGVDVVSASGTTFFFYDPERKFPFATLTTSDDEYDSFSDLSRPGLFRLNVGVSKQAFQSLFPAGDAGHDFTAPDRVMPHPVYGKMYWVCVLNPSEATFEAVKTLLAEAHGMAVAKYGKRESPAG